MICLLIQVWLQSLLIPAPSSGQWMAHARRLAARDRLVVLQVVPEELGQFIEGDEVYPIVKIHAVLTASITLRRDCVAASSASICGVIRANSSGLCVLNGRLRSLGRKTSALRAARNLTRQRKCSSSASRWSGGRVNSTRRG